MWGAPKKKFPNGLRKGHNQELLQGQEKALVCPTDINGLNLIVNPGQIAHSL